jgi:hypothetical protein
MVLMKKKGEGKFFLPASLFFLKGTIFNYMSLSRAPSILSLLLEYLFDRNTGKSEEELSIGRRGKGRK